MHAPNFIPKDVQPLAPPGLDTEACDVFAVATQFGSQVEAPGLPVDATANMSPARGASRMIGDPIVRPRRGSYWVVGAG